MLLKKINFIVSISRFSFIFSRYTLLSILINIFILESLEKLVKVDNFFDRFYRVFFLTRRGLTIRKQKSRRDKEGKRKEKYYSDEVWGVYDLLFHRAKLRIPAKLAFRTKTSVQEQAVEILMDSRKPFHFVEIVTVAPFVFLARVLSTTFCCVAKTNFFSSRRKMILEKI